MKVRSVHARHLLQAARCITSLAGREKHQYAPRQDKFTSCRHMFGAVSWRQIREKQTCVQHVRVAAVTRKTTTSLSKKCIEFKITLEKGVFSHSTV